MTLQELDNSLRKAYSKETCHPSYRDKWSKDNPTAGHCAIVSLIVNDVFGYPIYNTFVGSSRHFYNMNGKDIIDLTKDQFKDVSVDYTKGVERNRKDLLKNKDTKERYELLKNTIDSNTKALEEAMSGNYNIPIYRVNSREGEGNESWNNDVRFFAGSLDYFDKSDTGYDKKDAKEYLLNIKDFKVFDPMKLMDLEVDTWSTIWGTIGEFDKYGIYWECEDEDLDEDDPDYMVYTSTDDLAYAGKDMGYDVTILRDIPNDRGWGNEYTEYAVHNSRCIKSVNAKSFDKNNDNINEKFEEVEVDNDICMITNDINDIVRDIKNSARNGVEEKYIIDDNFNRYIELDPWFMIHDDAFDLAINNGWYPELCWSNERIEGKIPYDVYFDKSWLDGTLQFIKMMPLKDGETSSGYLGEEGFGKEYIYDGFSILTRTDLEKCSLYKALGTPKEVLNKKKPNPTTTELDTTGLFEATSKQTDCTDEVEKVFGTTDTPTLGPTYILPNGKFLKIPTPQQMGLGGLVKYKCHPLIAAWLLYMKRVKGTLWDMNAIDPMLDWGSIRANVGELEDTEALINYMVLPKNRITDAQRNAILTYLDYAQTQHQPSFEVDTNRTSVGKSYNFKEYTSDDILSKIDKYYASGKLTEGVKTKELPVPTVDDILAYKNKVSKVNYPIDRCFIADDGMFVDTIDNHNHISYEYNLQDKIAKSYNLHQWFVDNKEYNYVDHPITQYIFNWIRVNGYNEDCIVLPPNKLSEKQIKALKLWLDEYIESHDDITVVASNGNQKKYDLMDYEPKDILGFINRFYSSGELYETLDEDLTQGQLDYFKDSKVRDNDGNLLVCYHGTHTPGFKEFDASKGNSKFGKYKFNNKYNVNYFTTDRKSAASYTEFGYEHDNNVYACYINIENPYVVNNKTESDIKSSFNIKDDTLRRHQIELFDKIWKKWNIEVYTSDDINVDELNRDLNKLNLEVKEEEDYGGLYSLYSLGNNSFYGAKHPIEVNYELSELFDDDMYEQLKEDVLGISDEYGDNDYFFSTDDVVRYVLSMNEIKGTNYDGIIIPDIVDSMEMFSLAGTDVITLKSSNQIKLIDNVNPTNSNKIDEWFDDYGVDELPDTRYHYTTHIYVTNDLYKLKSNFNTESCRGCYLPNDGLVSVCPILSGVHDDLIKVFRDKEYLERFNNDEIRFLVFNKNEYEENDINDEIDYYGVNIIQLEYDKFFFVIIDEDYGDFEDTELYNVLGNPINRLEFEKTDESLKEDIADSFTTWQTGLERFEDVFSKEDIEYMNNNQEVFHTPLYRCQADDNNKYKIGDTIRFDRYRSFAKSEQAFYDVMYMWDDAHYTKNHSYNYKIFKTRGNVKAFDCTKLGTENKYLDSQEEVFVKGTFRIVGVEKVEDFYDNCTHRVFVIEAINQSINEESLIEERKTFETIQEVIEDILG